MLQTYKSKISLFSRNAKFLICSELLSATGMTFWTLLFNLYLKSLGHSREEIGNTLLCGNLAIAFAALPFAFLSNRHRYYRLMGLGQIFGLFFFFLSIFLTSKTDIRFCLFFAFALATASRILTSPFIMENSEAVSRTYLFSMHSIAGFVGGMLGHLLAGTSADFVTSFFHLRSIESYRVAMFIGLSLNFVGAALFISSVRAPKKMIKSYDISFSFFKNLDWTYFGKVIIPSNLIALGAGLIVQFLNLYLKDVFHASDSFIGIVMSLQSAGVMLALFVAPVIAEKIGKVKAVTFFYSLSIPFMIGLAFMTNLYWGSFFVIMRAALMNMANPISNSITQELCPPSNRTFLAALNTIFWALSWALAAFLYGTVFKGNYKLCFLVASGLYILATLIFFAFFKKHDPK